MFQRISGLGPLKAEAGPRLCPSHTRPGPSCTSKLLDWPGFGSFPHTPGRIARVIGAFCLYAKHLNEWDPIALKKKIGTLIVEWYFGDVPAKSYAGHASRRKYVLPLLAGS